MKRIGLFIFSLLLLIIGFNKVEAAIKIVGGEINIGVGDSYTLSTTGSNGNNIKWSSTDASVASVSESGGQVTGKKLGVTYITVTDGVNSDTRKVNVISNYVKVTDISIPKASDTILVNETKNIGASVLPSNASNKGIYYRSNDSGIARVDANGNVTGVSVGSTIIFISAESRSISYKVTVTNTIKLNGISVNKTYEIKEGESKKIEVTYNPSNASNKSVTFKSSNTKIVTVDDSGNIKGVAPGSATISVTSNDGSHVATSKITVISVDKTLKGISLNKKELKLDSLKSEQLTVKYNPENTDTKKVTWSSSDTDIATVEDGLVKAKMEGTAEIKAVSEDGKFEAICKVIVTAPPLENLSFVYDNMELYVGQVDTLAIKSTPTYAKVTDLVWTSSNEEVLTITNNGQVTAKTIGETTVTVASKDGKIKAETKITVVEAAKEPLVIKVSGYDINFKEEVKNYTIKIKNEKKLTITTNVDPSQVIIAGNNNLKNGSIITVTVNNNGEKQEYVFSIKKSNLLTIIFIGITILLVIINIVHLIMKKKKAAE